jgi:hypothetical protein
MVSYFGFLFYAGLPIRMNSDIVYQGPTYESSNVCTNTLYVIVVLGEECVISVAPLNTFVITLSTPFRHCQHSKFNNVGTSAKNVVFTDDCTE